MKRLSLPRIVAATCYQACVNGVLDLALKGRLNAGASDFESWAKYYEVQAGFANLFSIRPFNKAGTAVVFGAVTKGELSKLYSYYMVQKQPARRIYDEIMIAANEKCPYCGGIGRPRTLDHYLPKSKYPQFSVLPSNLLPCCRDCNSGSKQTSIATCPEEQVIHPYYDYDHFFAQQWIKARVHQDDPCFLEYFVDPPSAWSDIDKARVATHFNDFDLAVRYSIQAGEELSTLVDQRKSHMKNYTASQFSQYLGSIGNSNGLFSNHWKKIMYLTLADDAWFCNKSF